MGGIAMKRKGKSVVLHIVLLTFSVVTVLPFVWMLASSFKTNVEINALMQSFFPRNPTAQNYADVVQKFDFLRYFFNSFIYALTITAISVYTSALTGFVLCKYRFRGRQAVFTLILLTMMVPGVVTIIPRYSLMQELGWLDSYKALILPSVFTPFGIFMMRQASFSIPTEMLESARIDGANELYIFHKIALPQLRNAIVSISIFQFLWAWDDYLWPYLVIRSGEKQLLSIGLNLFSGRYSTDYAGLFAATSIAIIPVVVFYIMFQRHFIEGVSSASIKG